MASTAQAIALEILQSNLKLPPFPPIGSQLMAMNQQPVAQIDMDQFIRLIESDMSLSTHLLQLANSVYFGAVQKMSSLSQAVMYIGLEGSINAINLHFFRSVLPKFPNIEGFSGKDFWAHSWACGMANKMLGRPDLHITSIPGELYIANTSGVGNAGDLYAYDLEQTLLGRDLVSPLADAATRNRVVHDIHATLRKKYQAMSDGQDQTQPEKPYKDASMRPAESGPAPAKTRKKSRWLDRLLRLFK